MSMMVLVLAQAQVRAQPYSLQEDSLDTQCFHMRIEMDLKGKVTVKQDGKPATFPHDAKAQA